MDRPVLTHEARCLVILAGGVLEQCIEQRAREIAGSRSDTEITPEDVQTATAEFLAQGLSELPHQIDRAINEHWHGLTKAA